MGISGSEIFLIFLVALLFFGADKLPEIARGLGKMMREVKKATEDIKAEINTHTADVKNELEDIRSDLTHGTEGLKNEIENVRTDITHPVEDVKKDIHEAGKDMDASVKP